MMRCLCRFVPILLCALVSGCFLAHSLDEEPVGPLPSDAGLPEDAGWLLPMDAGEQDAGSPLECPLVRADATCLSDIAAFPGVPFELPVIFDTCECCPPSECHVELDAEHRTLRLMTSLCADVCVCETCVAPRGWCAIPPLDPGNWNVVVNGSPAFMLPVAPVWPGALGPQSMCMSFADPDRCATGEHIEPLGWRPDQVCVEPGPGERWTVSAISSCWGCQLEGPCIATLETRYTDELPGGGEIYLTPQRHSTTCEVDCPGVCTPFEQRCEVPPLVRGDFYRVWVDGEMVHSFVFEGEESCSSER